MQQNQNQVWSDIVGYFTPYTNDADVEPGCGAQLEPPVIYATLQPEMPGYVCCGSFSCHAAHTARFGTPEQASVIVAILANMLNAGIVIFYNEKKERLLFRHKKCI